MVKTSDAPPVPTRTVYCEDALPWLEARGVIDGASFVTSLPDYSELAPMSLEEWHAWFTRAARRVIESCPADGVAIFFQSDVVEHGAWIDKGHLVSRAADEAGARLLWHSIVCRAPAGQPVFGRPAYSHMLCFCRRPGPGPRPRTKGARVDVLTDAGAKTWTRGMGVLACKAACRFIQSHTASRVVVDPFCGHGTVLAVANALGLDAVGVEWSRRRAQKARNLSLEQI